MMYFRPKKKGVKVNLGRRREVTMQMIDILEVNDTLNKASIKSITGKVMVYHDSGVMNIANREIMKLLANDNLKMTTEFNFANIE